MAITAPIIIGGLAAAGGLAFAWPKDPVFQVQGITVSGFKLRFCNDSPLLVAVIDVEMTLSIKVINKNWVGIQHGETTLDIFYKDTLLGQASVSILSTLFLLGVFFFFFFGGTRL